MELGNKGQERMNWQNTEDSEGSETILYDTTMAGMWDYVSFKITSSKALM